MNITLGGFGVFSVRKGLIDKCGLDSYLVNRESYLASCGPSGGFVLKKKKTGGNLGMAKREGIGGVISILDSRCVYESMSGYVN